MLCPKCGYALDAFDSQCPKCHPQKLHVAAPASVSFMPLFKISWERVITPASGAIVGAIGSPLLTLWLIDLSMSMSKPEDDSIGPLTALLLMFGFIGLGILLGALIGYIANRIIKCFIIKRSIQAHSVTVEAQANGGYRVVR